MDAENQATIERACEQFGELVSGELARIERVLFPSAPLRSLKRVGAVFRFWRGCRACHEPARRPTCQKFH